MELKHHPQSTTKNELETFINLKCLEMLCYLFTPVMLAASTNNLFRSSNPENRIHQSICPVLRIVHQPIQFGRFSFAICRTGMLDHLSHR